MEVTGYQAKRKYLNFLYQVGLGGKNSQGFVIFQLFLWPEIKWNKKVGQPPLNPETSANALKQGFLEEGIHQFWMICPEKYAKTDEKRYLEEEKVGQPRTHLRKIQKSLKIGVCDV